MKKQKLIVNYFVLIRKTLSWLRSESNNLKGVALRDFDQLLSHLENVYHSRGLDFGIAYQKAVRLCVLNYLSGNPARGKGVKLSNRGLPSCLGPRLRKKVIQESPNYLRALMTILFASRSLKSSPSPDINTITGPLKKGSIDNNITLWAGDFWRQLGYFHKGKLPRAIKFRRFHFSTKSGPNGHALNLWLTDLVSLPKQLRDSIGVLGGDTIRNFMSFCLDNMSLVSEFFLLTDKRSYRKISSFADKEGKTRVIAIGDYFSQTVLKGLHKFLYKALKKIPQDMTYDQGAFKSRVSDWPVYYSVDLSAATDRFPIKIISLLLSAYFPKDYVKAWEDVMVGYPFDYKDGKKVRQLSYAVGNPMGFYSSWASFALAHHYIMYYLSRKLGMDFKTLPYCLLGDDIVIGNKDLGEAYLEVIESLGVEVSMSKTHKSSTTLEFAKRWIHKGQEITPFPLSSLKNAGDKYYLLTAVLACEERKGWSFEGIGQMVGAFYGIFSGRPSSYKKDLTEKAHTVEQIMKVIWGTLPAGKTLTSLARRKGHSFTLTDEVATNILANIAVECFARSNPLNQEKKGSKSLGALAEHCLIWLTGKFDERPEAVALLENPLLNSYGSIEQSYLDLLKLAKSIDTVGAGQWPVLLRAMTIPMSDALFIDRHEATEALGVSMIGKHIESRFKVLSQYPGLLN